MLGGQDAILGYALVEHHEFLTLCYHTVSINFLFGNAEIRQQIPAWNGLQYFQLNNIYFPVSKSMMSCINDHYLGFLHCVTMAEDPNNYLETAFNFASRISRMWPTYSSAPNNKDIWVSGGLQIKLGSIFIHSVITTIR